MPTLPGSSLIKLRGDLRWAWVALQTPQAHELWVADPSAAERYLIFRTRGDDRIYSADFHPLRDEICFCVGGMDGGLYRAAWPDPAPQRLTGGPDIQPLWAPDGDRIVFFRAADAARGNVMRLDVETRVVARVTRQPGAYVVTGFSADGKRVRLLELDHDVPGAGRKRRLKL